MGTNSALLCRRVIDNAYQVMAIQFIALAQATDCLEIRDKLCDATRKAYESVRAIQPFIQEDTPFYKEIEQVKRTVLLASGRPF